MARDERIIYRGTVYWLQSTGRYFSSRDRVNGERLLHRRIWADHNGPIPPKHSIHHKDHDWRNSDIQNLECMPSGQHTRMHMAKKLEDPAYFERNRQHLLAAQELAKPWHASDEGREWHRRHGRKSWEGRKPVGAKCSRCGVPYWTFYPDRSRFCGTSCMQAEAFRRYHTDQRACDWCGKTFVANKHRKTACCSRQCGNRKRAADQRLQFNAHGA